MIRIHRKTAGPFIVLSALIGLPALAQQRFVPAPHRPVPLAVPAPAHAKQTPPAVPRSMVGGFWRTDANYKSALHLKNGVANSSMTVTPILYLTTGVSYTLPDVTLEPAGTAIVDINAGLQQQGIAPWATLGGHVEVKYAWGWDALCATVRNVDTLHSELFNFSLRPSSPTGSQNPAEPLEGLWWKQEPNVSGSIALTNLSSTPLNAIVQVSDQVNTPLGLHSVTVAPHGTKLVNMTEVRASSSRTGGIRIALDGLQGDWVVTGWLEDQAAGYSANVPVSFPLPSTIMPKPSPNVAELGLMTGTANPMLSFPAGTIFTPYSVLRNISAQTVKVTPTLWWMEGGSPHYARLLPLEVLPLNSQGLDVPGLLSNAGLGNFSGSVNLVFDVSGPQTALLFAAGSVDQKNTYVFQVTPSAVSESVGTTFSYWSTGNGDDTMVTLWNPADQAQDFLFTLTFSGGHYAYPVQLNPRATRTFNISEVIRTQVPDSNGNVVPLYVHEGSATLTGSKSKAEHILVTADVGTYNVQKATCGNYCVNCSGSIATFIDPNNGTEAVATSMQLTYTSMHDDNFYYDITSLSSWSSSDTSIASMSGNSVTGVSPGTVQITASDPYEPVYVSSCGYQVPYDCSQFDGVATYAQNNVNCPTVINFTETFQNAGSDGTLFWNYTWHSSSGNQTNADLAACTIGETVFYPGTNDPYQWPASMVASTKNPTVISGSATSAGFLDRQFPPDRYSTPYFAASFDATQRFWWHCTCYQNDALQYPLPDRTIHRKVFQDTDGYWKYQVTKSGQSATVILP